MDIFIDSSNFKIREIKYSNTMIHVKNNFRYEEPKLLKNDHYILLQDTVRKLSTNYPYIQEIVDSHHIVEYLMIFMNHKCSQILLANRQGIFRRTHTREEIQVRLPNILAQVWSGICSEYVLGNVEGVDFRHESLNLDSYIQITSPIRRMVDLLNIVTFQKVVGLLDISATFFSTSFTDVEYINKNSKLVRKVQNDCSLLFLCLTNPSILETIYDGYTLTMTEQSKYTIYLPALKLYSSIKLEQELELYSTHKFKLFIFQNEDTFKKKIRLQIIHTMIDL
jgi:exoribonuclease R